MERYSVRIVESAACTKITNINAETVLVSKPPTEYLDRQTLTAEAIHNMLEINSTSEAIIY